MQTVQDQTETSVRSPAQGTFLRDLKPKDLIPLAICVGLLVWLYASVFSGWYGAWMKKDSYYSHGILVPFICGFIVWLKRKRLAEIPIRPDPLGYLLIMLSLPVVLIMTWAGATNPQGLVFPILVSGMVLVLLGRQLALELWFPLAYLFFMCVLPGDILTKLSFGIQMKSTTGAALALRLLGFDAYQDGTRIQLPNVFVQVGDPCSGFRLLISLFAFSSLFAYLKEGPLWGRLSLVAITLPMSTVLNIIRITMIAIVGEFFGTERMHQFHDYSGYLVLIMAFVALWFIARLVRCPRFSSMLSS